MPKLERWLALQIAGVYHLTPHAALAKTPGKAWQDCLASQKHPIRQPPDLDEFFLDFLPAEPRLVRRDGIHFRNIRYWDGILSPWAGRLKEPLLVKYDPRNLARIFLQDTTGRHWPIPYADLSRPPIALWELAEAQKHLRENARAPQTEQVLFANILEQRRIVQEAHALSKQRRRYEKIPTEPQARAAARRRISNEPLQSEELKPYPVELLEDI